MRNYILLFLLTLSVNLSFSQNFEELRNYEFKNVESYKTEQNKVLACSNYLFKTLVSKDLNIELNRAISVQYIIKWMSGTPDYTFSIGNEATQLTKGNDELLSLYFAALTKTVLENKNKKFSEEELYQIAEKMLVDYSLLPGNKIKKSKKIKKLIKARN